MDLGAISERLDGAEVCVLIDIDNRPAAIHQPHEPMGRIVPPMPIDLLSNPEKEITRIELPMQQIVRGSTASLKDKAG